MFNKNCHVLFKKIYKSLIISNLYCPKNLLSISHRLLNYIFIPHSVFIFLPRRALASLSFLNISFFGFQISGRFSS